MSELSREDLFYEGFMSCLEKIAAPLHSRVMKRVANAGRNAKKVITKRLVNPVSKLKAPSPSSISLKGNIKNTLSKSPKSTILSEAQRSKINSTYVKPSQAKVTTTVKPNKPYQKAPIKPSTTPLSPRQELDAKPAYKVEKKIPDAPKDSTNNVEQLKEKAKRKLKERQRVQDDFHSRKAERTKARKAKMENSNNLKKRNQRKKRKRKPNTNQNTNINTNTNPAQASEASESGIGAGTALMLGGAGLYTANKLAQD